MPDTNTQNLNDPQASVDAALGNLNPSTPTAAPTTPAAAAVPMGDDTPLAFAGATLSPLPETKSAMPTPTPTASPILDTPPVVEPAKVESPSADMGSSYLPPVPSMTTSTEQNVAAPKKKSKVLSIVLGLFVLFGALGAGGYYYYSNFMLQKPQIAILDVSNAADCKGCSPGTPSYEYRWHSATNKCLKSNITCGDTSGDAGANYTTKASCEANGPGNPGFWCAGCNGFCNTTNTQTCFQLQVAKCGEAVVSGASCSSTQSPTGGKFFYGCDCDNNGSSDKWFDKTGVCNAKAATALNASNPNAIKNPTDYDKIGLCAVAQNGCPDGNTTTGANVPMYTCDNAGCSLTAAGIKDGNYTIEKWTCDRITGLDGGCQDGKPASGNSQKFSATCGSEQIDVQKGSQLVDFRSRTNAKACTTNTITESHKACNTTTKVCETVTGPGANTCTTDANCVTAAPVLACTGLTQTPATTPAIGEKVTFTCAGSITPAGAATLSYKFRYSLDSGADQLLPNKTATTAELTIAACGTYSVQCKVCATIGGVLKCDPTWTGAIQ